MRDMDMKRKTMLICSAAVFGLCGLSVLAQQSQREQEKRAVISVIQNYWRRPGPFRKTLSWPNAQIRVQDSDLPVSIYRDEKDFNAQAKTAYEKEKELLEQFKPSPGNRSIETETVIETVKTESRPSNFKVEKLAEGVAYAVYDCAFVPKDKPAGKPLYSVRLLAVLKKEKGEWKIVFNTTP
jgi:hypothetical protein